MSDQARQNILGRLQFDDTKELIVELPELVPEGITQVGKVRQLEEMMTKTRTEVHMIEEGQLIEKLSEIVVQKKIQSLLYGKGIFLGKTINQGMGRNPDIELVSYNSNIEEFKEDLFRVEAGVTSTVGGIAETGTIVLWPSQEEPRLMSLVPPIHIAILEEDRIYHNFREMIMKENWNQEMPSNVLLISGPSKTGDIECILQYGVHGPKQLIVLIIQSSS